MALPLTPMLDAIAAVLRAELAVLGEAHVLSEPQHPEHEVQLLAGGNDGASLLISFEECFAKVNKTGNLADWLFPLFRREAPVRQSCDYVLFSNFNDQLCVLLIELKSGGSARAVDQLANTRLLVEWVLRVVARVETTSAPMAAALSAPVVRAVTFKVKAPYPKGIAQGLAYKPHAGVVDLPVATLPYSKYRVRHLWSGQVAE